MQPKVNGKAYHNSSSSKLLHWEPAAVEEQREIKRKGKIEWDEL